MFPGTNPAARLRKSISLAAAVACLFVACSSDHYPDQAEAVSVLHRIATAEVTYQSTYGGYSPSLAALDGSATPSTAQAAGLLEPAFAHGVYSGYRFDYSPGPPDAKGKITTYSLTASPLKPGGGNFFYTDQTGVIRVNTSRPATASDNPLEG